MATHSDKALATIAGMDTTPEQWTLTPIKWVEEERMVPGLVDCPECEGYKFVQYSEEDGKAIPFPQSVPYGSDDYFKRETEIRAYNAAARRQSSKSEGHSYGNCKNCRVTKRGWGSLPSGKVKGLVLRKVLVGYVLWPEGTKFDSRFCGSMHCNLCNKLVLKSNLIPVLAKGNDGSYHGMFVGADCVKKFLGNVDAIKKLNEDRFFAEALKG